MNNIKGYAIANDGNMKRIAITYDVIDDATGKPTSVNNKINQYVTDSSVLESIKVIDDYAQSVIDEQ